MKNLLSHILAGILGLWIAKSILKGVTIQVLPNSTFFNFPLTKEWQVIIVLGSVLGILNFFLKPFLRTFSLPLEIITFGIFTVLINMGFIWALDLMFPELTISSWLALLFTSLIIGTIHLIIKFLFLTF